MGKKVKKDEKPPPPDVFDPLLVESRQAATVVLMLSSPEEDVQSKACEAIYKFVDKCDENKKLLLDLNAVRPLLLLIQGEDHLVRRHAMMALGVMCQHPEVRRALRKREDAIPTFIHLLHTDVADLVVYEFAALALSFMAVEYSSKITIFENAGMEPLVRLLSNNDPDVQKNSIETIAQLALDYQARACIREYDGLPPILDLLKSEYGIIQRLALLALDRLMQDAENRAAMRELDGLHKLLDVLAKSDWTDLHVMTVMVISSLLEDHETLELMKESGGLKKMVSLITDQPIEDESKKKGDKGGSRAGGKKSAGKEGKGKKVVEEDEKEKDSSGEVTVIPTLPDVKMSAAKAIARCARNVDNRKLLHEQEVERMLITLLSHENSDVQGAAAHAIGIMCEFLSCRDAIREWEGLGPLVKLLNLDNGEVKEAVTLALANLTSSNNLNCHELVNLNIMDPLLNMLTDTREEIVANVACVLTNMAQDEQIRYEAHLKGAICALIEPLKSSNTNVQAKIALAISAFGCDVDARTEFREGFGLEKLVNLLHSGNDEVRRNAAWAITVLAMDEPTASEICKLGGLEILQQIQLSSSRESPFIDAALERLLDSNLSAKYAITGQLNQTNIIEDGFYDPGQLKSSVKFQTLEEYLREPLNDKRPIFYISAFQEASQTSEKTEEAEKPDEKLTPKSRLGVKEGKGKSRSSGSRSPETGRYSPYGSKKSKAQREKEERQREEELAAQREREAEIQALKDAEPPQPPADPAFVKYVEEVTENILPLPTNKEQIIALAEFVSEKMGGPIERGQLAYFGWELPLSQLRFEGKSNVVPIGNIKMGIHPHRALLFKALADRISISCSLVRGQYNRAWNEVLFSENEEEEKPTQMRYPPKTFIVDLVHQPGRLFPLDSREAVAYQKI